MKSLKVFTSKGLKAKRYFTTHDFTTHDFTGLTQIFSVDTAPVAGMLFAPLQQAAARLRVTERFVPRKTALLSGLSQVTNVMGVSTLRSRQCSIFQGYKRAEGTQA